MRTTAISTTMAFILVLSACQKESNDRVSTQDSSLKSGQSGKNFTVHLTGDNEVPPNLSQAVGEGIFHLKNDDTEIQYKLIVANIENVMMSHIHVALAGSNGPVVAWLYPSGPPPALIEGLYNGVLAQGVLTSANLVGPLAGQDLSVLIELMNTGGAYVNVHTMQYPGGEIRGQF